MFRMRLGSSPDDPTVSLCDVVERRPRSAGCSAAPTRGAREHNLKNVDLDLPRDKLIVITGLSGSGKSSLAFDTIYAEGQRRYVESCRPMRASSWR
jgi:ABC-type glutathione transport system ATPase component